MRKILTVLAGFYIGVSVAWSASVDDARMLAEDGNLRDAIAMLLELEVEQPKDADIPKLLGDYYMAAGDIDNARTAYETARKKGNRNAILGLAEIANNQYDVEGARTLIEDYRKTVRKGKRIIAEDESEDIEERTDRIENALGRVELIEVVDSMVVDAADFFRHYRLSPEAGSLNPVSVLPDGFEAAHPTVVYEPESGREMIWAAPGADGTPQLYSSSALYGDTWEHPVALGENLGGGGDANFPFLMPDGVTLYFASDGEDSLGGLDIYISRKGDDGFLQPQNLGMPYNSPYDDYMLAIDEFTGAGWWASDRNRIPGKVTIFVFVPQELRRNVDPDSPDLQARALLNNIRATWNPSTDREAVIRNIASIDTERAKTVKQFEIYIPGRGVLTNADEFRNTESRTAMNAYMAGVAKVTDASRRLASLRAAYSSGKQADSGEINALERQVEASRSELTELRNRVVTLETSR